MIQIVPSFLEIEIGEFILSNDFEIDKGKCYGSIEIAALMLASKHTNVTYTIKIKSTILQGGFTIKNTKRTSNRIFTRKRTHWSDFIYTKEYLENMSVEYLYNRIRFPAFPNKSESVLKSLFIKMAKVPISHKSLIPLVCDALNTRNFKAFVHIIEKFTIYNIEDRITKQGYEKEYNVNLEKVFDLYFSINDRILSVALLRHLIFFGGNTQNAYNFKFEYIESFEDKEKIVPKVVWNAFKI